MINISCRRSLEITSIRNEINKNKLKPLVTARPAKKKKKKADNYEYNKSFESY